MHPPLHQRFKKEEKGKTHQESYFSSQDIQTAGVQIEKSKVRHLCVHCEQYLYLKIGVANV